MFTKTVHSNPPCITHFRHPNLNELSLNQNVRLDERDRDIFESMQAIQVRKARDLNCAIKTTYEITED